MNRKYAWALLFFGTNLFAQGLVPAAKSLCTAEGFARSEFANETEVSRHGASDVITTAKASISNTPILKALPPLGKSQKGIFSKGGAPGAFGEGGVKFDLGSDTKLDKDALQEYLSSHPSFTTGKFNEQFKWQIDQPIGLEQFVLGAGKPSPFMAIFPEKPTNAVLPYRTLTIGEDSRYVAFDFAGADSCSPAVTRVRQSDSSRSNRTILSASAACALLNYDTKCLTQEANAEFIDLEAAKRSVVALMHKGEAWCMGLLLKSGATSSIVTARHCFARPTDGKEWEYPHLRQGESLDGKRAFTITDAAVAKVIPGVRFGANSDAVVIPVTLSAAADAKPLPAAVWMKDAPLATVVWIPGVVTDLLEAMQMRNRVEKGSNTILPWRDSVRWGKWLNGDAQLRLSEAGCQYYSAQTWRGFSGAPIVSQATAAQIVIVGVHSGAVGASGDSDWKTCGQSTDARIAAQKYNLGDGEISQ